MSPAAKRSSKKAKSKKATRAPRKKAEVLSTSHARAHFAEALETAAVDKAVIGFDRYGRTVAALLPVEAIYMLAGMGRLVPAATRKQITQGAGLFIRTAEGLSTPVPAKAKKRAKRAPPKAPARRKRPRR